MYKKLLNEAMLDIVRKVLESLCMKGIEDEQSIYISFRTDHVGVVLSDLVKSKYPREITVVLQHQFKNLEVFHDRFEVSVAFDGIPETIAVPFLALTGFVDPAANFGFQFKQDVNGDGSSVIGGDLVKKAASPNEENLAKGKKSTKKTKLADVIPFCTFKNQEG